METGGTLDAALVREPREELGVVPAAFRAWRVIADPDARGADPAAWSGGEPAALGDERSQLRWFDAPAASALPDFALDEYRRVLEEAFRPPVS